MNTQTEKPSLPAEITVSTLSKWLDDSDKKSPQIRFKLEIAGPGGKMQTDYSGGILAFPSKQTVRERAIAIRPVRTVQDANECSTAVQALFRRAKADSLSVIHSLISDSDAGQESFADFCSELGYGEDSRSAYKIWETCNEQGAKFRRIVGKHMETLRELTQDL